MNVCYKRGTFYSGVYSDVVQLASFGLGPYFPGFEVKLP